MSSTVAGILCVCFIAYLIINGYLAKHFQEAAEAKNWHDEKYFWICFFFGICGWLLVIALPDRGMQGNTTNEEIPEL